MTLNRYAQRQDGNAAELIKLARQIGMSVEYIGRPVDLVVVYRSVVHLVEIKDKYGKYTPAQEDFIKRAKANGVEILTWRTTDDVLEMLK